MSPFYLQVVSLPNRQSPVAARGLQPYPESKMSTWINTIARERKLYCNMPSQAELHKPEFLIATLAAALLGRHGLGNSQYEAIVHDILAKNKYIMTPDYKMKMLHIEVRWLLTLLDAVSESAGLNSLSFHHLTYLLWYVVLWRHHKCPVHHKVCKGTVFYRSALPAQLYRKPT